MQTMDKASERRILQAIEKTAGYVNAGLSPNAAIVKAASEDGIPPGHVNLMVTAYNTGRTNRQLQTGETVLEKAADFELADASTVLEQLYPSKVKTAAEVHRDTTVSFEYAIPASYMLQRREQELRKAAAVQRPLPPLGKITPPPPMGDPADRAKKAFNRQRENNRRIDESRRQVSVSFDKMASHFQSLTSYFRTSGHASFPHIKKLATILHGAAGEVAMEQIGKLSPILTKQAAVDLGPEVNAVPLRMLRDLLEETQRHRSLQANHEKFAARLTQDTEDTLRPFVQPLSQSVLVGLSSTKEAGLAQFGVAGAAGGLMNSVMKGVAQATSPADNNTLVQKSLQSLQDPQHEAAMRNIRTQGMLQDLMANDQVISSYDPDDVLESFNLIGEIAPRAVDQRMLMQSLLRKQLQQGALDPFDVDQLLGMEDKLKKRTEVKDDMFATA